MKRLSLVAVAVVGLWGLGCMSGSAPKDGAGEQADGKKGRKSKKGKAGKAKPAEGDGAQLDKQCTVFASLPHADGTVALKEKPDKGAPTVAELPADHEHLRVKVVGRKDGYLRVSGAEVVRPKAGAEAGPVEVKGWIDGRTLRVGLEPCTQTGEAVLPLLFAEPSLDAKVAHSLDAAGSAKVLGCSGSWWRVSGPGGVEGWVHPEQWCANGLERCETACKELAGR